VDGCSARLATVVVRPGKPNAATTSCFSGVVREPLSGVDVALPVDRSLPHACSSTRSLVSNLKALHDANFGQPGKAPVDRGVCMPSISITLQDLIDGMMRVVPGDQHHRLGKITDTIDPFLSKVVGGMAVKQIMHHKALALGLTEVPDVDTIVREYIEDFGDQAKVVVTLPTSRTATGESPLKRLRPANAMPVKVAVVTGAGSGVGRASAIALAKSGNFSCVALAGRRREALEETVALINKEAAHVEVAAVTCDVCKCADVERLFKEVEHRFGRCDLLFNNAGTGVPPTPMEDVSVEAFKRCIDANVTGTFLCTQQAFKLMKSQKPRGGRIINNGSVSADRPRPMSAAYTASKHAVTGLTKSTALDGRPFDIACGQIDIGNTLTDMSAPLGKDRGALQATVDGSERRLVEPLMDVSNIANSVVHMSSLPLDANVLFMTVMATKMPLVGRG